MILRCGPATRARGDADRNLRFRAALRPADRELDFLLLKADTQAVDPAEHEEREMTPDVRTEPG